MLSGMKLLDLSLLLPGPLCSLMLASLGAEVIKIEPVGKGDPMRYMMSGLFDFLNRNKKSLTLNLKSEKGREALFRLAEKCNVVLESFRPGVAQRLGIDYGCVQKINPEIIYCSISGYGQDGPYAHLPGHDLNYQAVAGLVGISGNPDAPPDCVSGIQVADICGAMFALPAILASYSLYLKEGKGQYIDVSMTDGVLAWLGPRLCEWYARGKPDKERLMARGAYGIFRTKDGKYVSLGIVENHFWENFCHLIGRPDLLVEAYATWEGRNSASEVIQPIIRNVIGEKTRDEWLALLSESNIPAAPVHFLSDLAADPQLIARGLFEENQAGGYFVQPFPVKFSGNEFRMLSPAPEVGAHNRMILEELGYTDDEIASLEDEKVI